MRNKHICKYLGVLMFLALLFLPMSTHAEDEEAYARLETKEGAYIHIWKSGYSDWLVTSDGKEQLSGDWAAAVKYDGIKTPRDLHTCLVLISIFLPSSSTK